MHVAKVEDLTKYSHEESAGVVHSQAQDQRIATMAASLHAESLRVSSMTTQAIEEVITSRAQTFRDSDAYLRRVRSELNLPTPQTLV